LLSEDVAIQHSKTFTVYDNEKFLASSLQQLRSAVCLCIHVNTYVALIFSNCSYWVSIKLKYTETKQLDCNLQETGWVVIADLSPNDLFSGQQHVPVELMTLHNITIST